MRLTGKVCRRCPIPIPLYVLYWTAWVDEDGTIHFCDDVYHYDAALERAVR